MTAKGGRTDGGRQMVPKPRRQLLRQRCNGVFHGSIKTKRNFQIILSSLGRKVAFALISMPKTNFFRIKTPCNGKWLLLLLIIHETTMPVLSFPVLQDVGKCSWTKTRKNAIKKPDAKEKGREQLPGMRNNGTKLRKVTRYHSTFA